MTNSALAPFFHDIDDTKFQTYSPNKLEEKYHRIMQGNIQSAINYRKKFEPHWLFGARRFNLLNEKLEDPRLSNILFPLIKIVIMARIAAMTEAMPSYSYHPGHDDEDKVPMWEDARRYTDNKTNMYYVMQTALLNMCIYGTGVLWDGYQNAYMTRRFLGENGMFDEKVIRDPRNSMIFTRSVSPFHHYISGGGQNQLDAPFQGVTVYMHYDQWVSEFARVPNCNGQPLYSNVDAVRPGKAYVWAANETGEYGFRQRDMASQMIAVTYHWHPVMDLHMIESNGVLNWLGPNPYKHGRSPFSLLVLHPQLDDKGDTQAIYGEGDPHLMGPLDALYNTVGNMGVDGLYMENCSVIGVPQGLNLDIDDQDFYHGTIIKGGEGLVTNQLGKMSGNTFQFMDRLNEIIIWATGVPFTQLTGDATQITAYELAERVKLSNKRMNHVLKYNENLGLKNHGEMRLSNIYQFLPKEEFYDITDPDSVDELIKEGKIADTDIIYEDGVAVQYRTYPMIETKGRVIKEQFRDGKPVPGGAKIVVEGKNGRLPFRPEYVLPTDWLRSNCLPDVMVDSSQMFGTLEAVEAANTFKGAEYAQARNEEAKKTDPKAPDVFNMDEVDADVVRTLKKNPDKWLAKGKNEGFKIGEEDTQKIEEEMRQAQAEKQRMDAEQAMVARPGGMQPQDAGMAPAAAPAPAPAGKGFFKAGKAAMNPAAAIDQNSQALSPQL